MKTRQTKTVMLTPDEVNKALLNYLDKHDIIPPPIEKCEFQFWLPSISGDADRMSQTVTMGHLTECRISLHYKDYEDED